MLRHLTWNQLKHVLHKMASWLFLTALSHSPHGYFGGTLIPLGPGLDEISPQTSSFLSKLKLAVPLVVYWILHEVNRLTPDLDLRYVVEFGTSSVARSVWKTLPTCIDRDMITLSVFSLMVVAVISKKARIRRELEQVWPAAILSYARHISYISPHLIPLLAHTLTLAPYFFPTKSTLLRSPARMFHACSIFLPGKGKKTAATQTNATTNRAKNQ